MGNGRNKKNRGHTVAISCSNCTRMVPKDKAIKRYNVRDMVDASSRRDLKEASVYEYFQVPRSTLSSLTAFPALSMLELSESDLVKTEKSELPPAEFKEMIKEESSLPAKRRKNEE